jgi:hypothetical protein
MSLAEPRLGALVARQPSHGPRAMAAVLALGMTLAIVAAFAGSVTAWTPAAIIALPLVALTAIWISGGAATALLGLLLPAPPRAELPAQWRPSSRTAILVTLCKENPGPVALHLAALRGRLTGPGLRCGPTSSCCPTRPAPTSSRGKRRRCCRCNPRALSYRRRARNAGRKPGNIGDWVDTHGAALRSHARPRRRQPHDARAHRAHDLADGTAPDAGSLAGGDRAHCRGARALAGISGSRRACCHAVSAAASPPGAGTAAITGVTTRSCVSRPSAPPAPCPIFRGGPLGRRLSQP